MSNSSTANTATQPDTSMWKEIVARYQKPSVSRATWQMVNTIIPFIGLWVAMYLTKGIS